MEILELDPDGTEQYRVEGFLETPDFLAQLKLGLGKSAFKAKRWQDAESQFREVVDRFGQSDGAAEALYWAGVSRYKASGDASALKETGTAFGSRYRESPWAKKASIGKVSKAPDVWIEIDA